VLFFKEKNLYLDSEDQSKAERVFFRHIAAQQNNENLGQLWENVALKHRQFKVINVMIGGTPKINPAYKPIFFSLQGEYLPYRAVFYLSPEGIRYILVS
jgi:hypothetical protein